MAVPSSHVEALEPALQQLLAMAPVKLTALPQSTPARGVYLLSEGNQHLYVGRSNRIPARLRNHGRAGATYRQAAFAFRLARQATGNAKATYTTEGSRRALMQDPAFVAAFTDAKARIARMDLRFVPEADAVRQALLEIYVATVLGTPYNDFDTH